MDDGEARRADECVSVSLTHENVSESTWLLFKTFFWLYLFKKGLHNKTYTDLLINQFFFFGGGGSNPFIDFFLFPKINGSFPDFYSKNLRSC